MYKAPKTVRERENPAVGIRERSMDTGFELGFEQCVEMIKRVSKGAQGGNYKALFRDPRSVEVE